ncbi:MAG: hypothetical protein GQ477_05345 [Nanohaloarchaea archaeon]|nr:hypothetical protein [Candidatus Nanohaloarchaea archaeon]
MANTGFYWISDKTEEEIISKTEEYMDQCFKRFSRPDGRHIPEKKDFFESVISGLSCDPQDKQYDGKPTSDGIQDNNYANIFFDGVFYVFGLVFSISYLASTVVGNDETTTDGLHGDVNHDGELDVKDVTLVGQNYGKPVTDETKKYDLNDDGIIDDKDIDEIVID